MLTGDKLETAIEIARSCHVIQDNMKVLIIGMNKKEEILRKMEAYITKLDIDIYDTVLSLKEIGKLLFFFMIFI